MWTRAELKENAKKFFKFNYWKMVVASLALAVATGGGGGSASGARNSQEISDSLTALSSAEIMAVVAAVIGVVAIISVLAIVISVFVLKPLEVGAQRFFVVSHYQKAELDELGYAFKNSYMNVVKTLFLRGLFVSLWSLLFIIPGIIKSYEYRMIPYLLAENPDMDYREAFEKSKMMMTGQKWNAFVLDLSFIGWVLLGAVTCGILSVFYVNPYIYMTNAELYVALKENTFGSTAPMQDASYEYMQ